LYQIEKTGRIMEVVGFDSMLWSTSDKVSRLKKIDLYHTGVADYKWAKDSKTITITLDGSSDKSEDGLSTVLTYNLISHAISTKTEQDGGGNAHEPPSHPSTAASKSRATPQRWAKNES